MDWGFQRAVAFFPNLCGGAQRMRTKQNVNLANNKVIHEVRRKRTENATFLRITLVIL